MFKGFSPNFFTYGDVGLTSNTQPGRPGYPFSAGSSPFTRRAWEIRTVATLASAKPTGSSVHAKAATTFSTGSRIPLVSINLHGGDRESWTIYDVLLLANTISMGNQIVATRYKPVSKNQPITWNTQYFILSKRNYEVYLEITQTVQHSYGLTNRTHPCNCTEHTVNFVTQTAQFLLFNIAINKCTP